MPVEFTILPQHNLALFTYSGLVTFQDSANVVAAAAAHPNHSPSMRQICDVSRVTGVEKNYFALLQMQAQIVDSIAPKGSERLVIFYAPGKAGQEMAQLARKSWEGLNSVIILVQDDEAAALALLGIPQTRLATLLERAN